MISLQPVRTGASVAITILENMFGIDSDIYYPKGGFSRGGRLDDVKYDSEPDLTKKLLLLDPYTGKPLVQGGAHNNFGLTLTAFIKYDVPIYRFSKIVSRLNYVITKYKVEEIHTHHDTKGALYKKLELSPISETLKDEEVTVDENEDFKLELQDGNINIDNSIVNTKNMKRDSGLILSEFVPANSKSK